jgi:hypothetical protein
MTTSPQLTAPRPGIVTPRTRGLVVMLCVVDAALLVASGAIHLHLWQGPYRHIPHSAIDTMFIVQWVACFVLAAALLVMRNAVAVIAAAGLMAGTLIGYFISRYRSGGIFGFHLPYTTYDAKWALAVEIAALVSLVATGIAMLRGDRA